MLQSWREHTIFLPHPFTAYDPGVTEGRLMQSRRLPGSD